MNGLFKDLAKQKWFVPVVLFLLLLIAISSWTDLSAESTAEVDLNFEREVEELCNVVQGVSNAKVMITYAATPASNFFGQEEANETILAIAVVCEGGGDPNVQLSLHELLETLFQLPSTHITISERK